LQCTSTYRDICCTSANRKPLPLRPIPRHLQSSDSILIHSIWVRPKTVTFDDSNKFIKGICGANISLHDLLPTIKCDLIWPSPNITIICVRHFTRTVDDTTHNPDF